MDRLWRPRNVNRDQTARDAAVEINEEKLYLREHTDGSIMLRTHGDAFILVVADESDCAILPMTATDCRMVLNTLQKFFEEQVNVRGLSDTGGGNDRDVALGSGEAA